jgi:pyruvate, orthophosphate dikinase
MTGLPVTVRLLDPPLHEFIPHTDEDIDALAASSGIDAEKLKRRAKELHETNPMLGHRGCRLGVAYPEIYEMQVRAVHRGRAGGQADLGRRRPSRRSCTRWSLSAWR